MKFLFTLILLHNALNASCRQYECGKPVKELVLKRTSKRIFSGVEAVPHSIPWQVNLMIGDISVADDNGNCGGTLIPTPGMEGATKLVLTAAHCVTVNNVVRKPKDVFVVAGLHDQNVIEPSVRLAKVKSIVNHPEYKSNSTKVGDISLLLLEKAIPYSDEIIPACLPISGELPNRSKCIVSGWGKTQSGDISPTLQMAVQTISNSRCDLNVDFDAQFCGVGHGYQSPCSGDSGGPFVCHVEGQYVLVGVVSFGKKNCKESIYTKVGHYLSWLNETISKI